MAGPPDRRSTGSSRRGSSSRRSDRLSSARALGIGLEFGTAIAGLALLGYALDRYFGTSPWLAMIGSMLGIVGGVYNVLRAVRRYTR